MKKFALLVFFVVPHLMYASFETHACNKALERIDAEWAAHSTLLVRFDAIPNGEKMQGVPILREAIESCHRAIGNCDYVLGKIEHKSKREREQHYWTHVKGECKQYKTVLFQEIDRLHGLIFDVFKSKAADLYKKGFDKAELANAMREKYPRRLDNVEDVKRMLSEAIKLYEEASASLREVPNVLAQYSSIKEINEFIQGTQHAVEAYQHAIRHCQEESMKWAETIVNHVLELQNTLASFVTERIVLIEQENQKELEEIDKKISPLVQKLIDYGVKDLPEELKKLVSSASNRASHSAMWEATAFEGGRLVEA